MLLNKKGAEFEPLIVALVVIAALIVIFFIVRMVLNVLK
jgi:hypothetical protein